MKCLEIKNGKGYFLNADGEMVELDKMKKDDLLYLLDILTKSSFCNIFPFPNGAHASTTIFFSLQKFNVSCLVKPGWNSNWSTIGTISQLFNIISK